MNQFWKTTRFRQVSPGHFQRRCIVRFVLLILVLTGSAISAAEPTAELLWPHAAPAAKGDKPADKPTITAFFPKESNAAQTAVVIYPGGAYAFVATDYGRRYAEWFNAIGIAGFVVNYRQRGGGYTHLGSQINLLGENLAPKSVRSLSSEKQVTPETPPIFLLHTDEDTAVPAENSVQFYLSLRRAGVPAEMHIYQIGVHGVGLDEKIPGICTWPDRLKDWMQLRGLLRIAKP